MLVDKLFCFVVVVLASTSSSLWSFPQEPTSVNEQIIPKIDMEKCKPWFTGPIIAAPGQNTAPGQWFFNPYVTYFYTYGQTDGSWKHHNIHDISSVQTSVTLQTGITDWLDIKAYGQYETKQQQGSNASGFNDTFLRLGLQFLTEEEGSCQPNVRLTILEILPTGQYKNLNSKKYGLDAFGNGSYETFFNLIFSKKVGWIPCHPLNLIANFAYSFPTKVRVHGYNAYGGGKSAKGTVHLGNASFVDLAFELSFTQRFAFAMDAFITHRNHSNFSGKRAITMEGTKISNSSPASTQISLAPALEYFFTEKLSILAGSWFSVAARNNTEFASATLFIFYEF